MLSCARGRAQSNRSVISLVEYMDTLTHILNKVFFFLFEGLCDIKTIPWKLAVYCAAVLRILAHGNNKVKAKIIEEGGVAPLLELCDPVELETNEITIGKG